MPHNHPSRDPRIDLLRIFAAFWVILFHWWAALYGYQSVFPESLSQFANKAAQLPFGPLYGISVLGDNAVPLFIIISAYLLSKQDKAGWGWLPNRLKKILFPYWTALLLSLPFLALAWQLNPMLMKLAKVKPLTLESVIAAFLLLQNTLKETFLAPVQAWWFIPILLQLYLLYTPLRWLQKQLSVMVFLGLSAFLQLCWNILVISLLLRTAELPVALRYSGPSYLLLFAIGMVLARTKTSTSFASHELYKESAQHTPVASARPFAWPAEQATLDRQNYTVCDQEISVTRSPFLSAKLETSFNFITGISFWIGGIFLRFATQRLVLFSETLIGTGLFLVGLPLAEALLRRAPALAEKLSTLGEKRSYQIYLLHQPILYLLLIVLLPLASKPLITILPFLVAGIWAVANTTKGRS